MKNDILYDYIVNNYEKGELIFANDILIENMSEVNKRQRLHLLTYAKVIERYEPGIFYLPKETMLKESYTPSAEMVARNKYVTRKGIVMGYYSGHTFANQIGVSTQVPAVEEIVSNNCNAQVREVRVGNQSFIIRKPKVEVTEENHRVLQLLDLLKNLDQYMDTDMSFTAECLANFISTYRITRNDIDRYIGYFPMKTYKHIYETRLEHVLA